jgi:uncharacterized protein YjiS (DUF1127 family)
MVVADGGVAAYDFVTRYPSNAAPTLAHLRFALRLLFVGTGGGSSHHLQQRLERRTRCGLSRLR